MRRRALLVLALPASLVAQSPSLTWTSNAKARAVVDSAVVAMGGMEALVRIADVSRELAGDRTDVGQGPRPVIPAQTYSALGVSPPALVHPRVTSIRDYVNGRALDRSRAVLYGGQIRDISTVVAAPAPATVYYDYVSKAVRTQPPGALPIARANAFRRYPEWIVRAAANRLDGLRYIGEATADGRTQAVVSFADQDGTALSLFFDAATHLLTKSERVNDDSIFGDGASETYYLDYQKTNGVPFPMRVVDRVSGLTIQDLRVTSLAVNTKPADSLFAKPAFEEVPPPAAGPIVEKLSDDAIAVYGNDYNSVAYAFNDYVLVLEAGSNSRWTSSILAEVKKAFPNKPVKYVVATHWNFDHLGGIRTYVAEGTTIVTTPLAKPIIELAANAPHTMRPDALSRVPRPPVIETVTGPTRVFTDGARIVEIYSIGRNPHVDEMLVAWLPKEKILFEADLLDLAVKGHVGTGGDDTMFLSKFIESLHLDVKRIIPVHGDAATMDDLRDALSKRAVAQAGRIR